MKIFGILMSLGLYLLIAIGTTAGFLRADELGVDQRLIVACHRIDIDGVIKALREGANVNGRFGNGDEKIFQDPWSLGWPMGGKNWTPLIALASASEYPNPPRKVENTSADLDWATAQKKGIPRGKL